MDKLLGAVEEHYRLLIETAQDFIYTVNADFSLTYLNRAAATSGRLASALRKMVRAMNASCIRTYAPPHSPIGIVIQNVLPLPCWLSTPM
jgi:hypothetical protein